MSPKLASCFSEEMLQYEEQQSHRGVKCSWLHFGDPHHVFRLLSERDAHLVPFELVSLLVHILSVYFRILTCDESIAAGTNLTADHVLRAGGSMKIVNSGFEGLVQTSQNAPYGSTILPKFKQDTVERLTATFLLPKHNSWRYIVRKVEHKKTTHAG